MGIGVGTSMKVGYRGNFTPGGSSGGSGRSDMASGRGRTWSTSSGASDRHSYRHGSFNGLDNDADTSSDAGDSTTSSGQYNGSNFRRRGAAAKKKTSSVNPQDKDFSPEVFLNLVHGNTNFTEMLRGASNLGKDPVYPAILIPIIVIENILTFYHISFYILYIQMWDY
jgi:hypothetical protein